MEPSSALGMIRDGREAKTVSGMRDTQVYISRDETIINAPIEFTANEDAMSEGSDDVNKNNKKKSNFHTGKTSMNITHKSKWTSQSKAYDDGFDYGLRELISSDF